MTRTARLGIGLMTTVMLIGAAVWAFSVHQTVFAAVLAGLAAYRGYALVRQAQATR